MGILAWIGLGVVLGLAARAIMPGDDPGGRVVTVVLGIVGAVIAGFIATLLGVTGVTEVSLRSALLALAGAVILLLAYRFLVARRSTSWE